MNNEFNHDTYWSDTWIKHIESYLAVPPRAGYWITSHFPVSLSILEIAGGSCRDSRYLVSQDLDVIGSDFDQKTLDYLAKRYPESPLLMQKEDAFSLSFANKSIGLSFSNGFWVLFENNQQIYSLIHEQARITEKYMISLVHNIENIKLVNQFKECTKLDSLYDIRFFHREELLEIINESGLKYKSIVMRKFGGPIDKLLTPKIKGIKNPIQTITKKIVPHVYDYQPWTVTERIACVIEL
ncbi:methyltransferase domain-containing protein [Leptolyngbyaceae cyanobacterium CCMR0082]|uniref:Methyltransferase domain-containing protein n=1 Tax=Adonisia turfae CCMR0082 TaxID=2304604 RepID=A0A6M0SDY9_9CYAN|nr:methyltransferase domain-containing protein [Adonisia turfae]MDV3350377.1 methyltransferase domain-containing protein [Leptothoe sp. LEGE 181152]NEZ66556.1 methyltransferase domain-containing protein [Adonisia turfae CCMR0082]